MTDVLCASVKPLPANRFARARFTSLAVIGIWKLSLQGCNPGQFPEISQVLRRQPNDAIAILRLNRQPPENHCRPAVDVLFRSAANLFGGHVLGVILTGMGSDGLIGSRLIRERGGMILAQDQATSAVWGMPGAVTQAGLAQRVLPLNAIAPEILRLAGRSKREAQELRESTVNL